MPRNTSLERHEDVATKDWGVVPTTRHSELTRDSAARSGPRVVTDRSDVATDADTIRAAGIYQPAAAAALANRDSGRAPLAQRMRSAGINRTRAAVVEQAGNTTDAVKILAAGLEQPTAIAGLTNADDGHASLAQRIKSDGLN